MVGFLSAKSVKAKASWGIFVEIGAALRDMPPTMKQLWWVKFFTWYGLPLMWQYLSLAIARTCVQRAHARIAGVRKRH